MNCITIKSVLENISGKALGDFLGIAPQAIYQWKIVPTERVIAVCRATGWKFTPHELRPDIYPNVTDAIPPGVTVNPKNSQIPEEREAA